MGIEKLLAIILNEGVKNPKEEIGQVINRANPFIIKNFADVYANGFDTNSEKDFGDKNYLRQLWDIADKSKVKIKNIDFVFDNISYKHVKDSKEDEKKSLYKVVDYVIENMLEEWLKIMLKNELTIDSERMEANIYRLDRLVVESILDNKEYVKKLREVLGNKEFKIKGKEFKEGVLFKEFNKNNKFINEFYGKEEGIRIFNKFGEMVGEYFSKEQGKNSNYLMSYNNEVKIAKEAINAGFKMQINNRKFEILYNRILGVLLSREYTENLNYHIVRDVVELIEGRKYLKVDDDNQQKLKDFIERMNSGRGKKANNSSALIVPLVPMSKQPKAEEAMAGLEKAYIGLVNSNSNIKSKKVSKL